MSTPDPFETRYPDARNVVTPDAFRVDPSLLGAPLARPWRRGAAMAVDGLLIALLANAPNVLFGFAAAFVLFRASARSREGGFVRRSVRLALRVGGAVVLFVVVLSVWNRAGEMMEDDEDDDVAEVAVPGVPDAPPSLTGMEGISVAADVLALTRETDEAAARERVESLVESLRRAGVSDAEIREVVEGVAETPGRPWMAAVADSLLAEEREERESERLSADSLAVALASALAAGDSAEAASLRFRLGYALAADTLALLSGELQEARSERARLRRQRDEAREELERGPGIMGMLRSLADDLGLGFGWSGLYFTASLALWRGYTPGKRLFRIRVIRLDGRPIGWWAAFERFGGYAASIATGLFGFFQILWDRNRQGIHDKITETVVVRT